MYIEEKVGLHSKGKKKTIITSDYFFIIYAVIPNNIIIAKINQANMHDLLLLSKELSQL